MALSPLEGCEVMWCGVTRDGLKRHPLYLSEVGWCAFGVLIGIGGKFEMGLRRFGFWGGRIWGKCCYM